MTTLSDLSRTNAPLIRDLLDWLADGPRPYQEALEIWRTSCPRLTVWEDAFEAGLVHRQSGADGPELALTPAGQTERMRRL